MFTVDQDKLKNNADSGSLLTDLWPPGFEDDGRRVLAKCDEMTLYELYRPGGEQEVVLAPEIERTLWRHLFRINDTFDFGSFERKDRDRRVARAIALKRLHHFTVRRHRKGERIGSVQAAQALAESLGEDIDQAIKSRDIEKAAQRIGNRVADCVKALAREQGKLRDGRTKKDRIPVVAKLILAAQEEFMLCGGKPPREVLMHEMKRLGYRYSCNDSAGRWKETFLRAGLSSWY